MKTLEEWVDVASLLSVQSERQRRAFFEMVEGFASVWPERASVEGRRSVAYRIEPPASGVSWNRPTNADKATARVAMAREAAPEPVTVGHWGMHA